MLAGAGDKLYAQGCLELFVSMGGTLRPALTKRLLSNLKNLPLLDSFIAA